MIVFEADNPEDLRKEIIEHIEQRRKLELGCLKTAQTKSGQELFNSRAALLLEVLADLKMAAIWRKGSISNRLRPIGEEQC